MGWDGLEVLAAEEFEVCIVSGAMYGSTVPAEGSVYVVCTSTYVLTSYTLITLALAAEENTFLMWLLNGVNL